MKETLIKKPCTQDNDASVPLKVGALWLHRVLPASLPLFKTLQKSLLESPSAAPSYFPESNQQSEISLLSKVILVLGKARSCRIPNLGCRGAEPPGWFDVLPKNSAWDLMHERACCHDEVAHHQLPIPAAFWIARIVSAEECSRLTQNLMQISLLYSLKSFWMWWPHSTHAHSMASTAPTDY